MKVRVWRVEDKEGNGPYHNWESVSHLFGLSSCEPSENSRWPMHDGISQCSDDIRFAFSSKTDLLNWFDKDLLKSLIPFGYCVRSYLVDPKDVIHGKKQVAVKGLRKTG